MPVLQTVSITPNSANLSRAAGFHREYLNQGPTSTANHATDSNLDFIPNPTIDTTRQHWHHVAASHSPKTAMSVLQTVSITPTGVNLSRTSRISP